MFTSPPIKKILDPIRKFLQIQTSSGIILISVTVLALIWVNTSYSNLYFGLWSKYISIGFGEIIINKPLIFWINEGLMTLFFFVVGLEIKRELFEGELSSIKKASLPIVAALGGMIFPAIIYLLFNYGTDRQNGWGIPVATDIAFSVGILSLVRTNIPFSLKVFLTAFAIIDDLGAVIVIAVFYSTSISFISIGIGLLILGLILVLNLLNIKKLFVYFILGICLWIAFLKAGIHPTIAGVMLAFMIPYKVNCITDTKDVEAQSNQLEQKLNPFVSYFIVPLFAFTNAGVSIKSDFIASLHQPITLGVILGLVLGKQFGIFLSSIITNKLKVTELPNDSSRIQLYGVSILGGIGFTMSLFISSLAFSNSVSIEEAKIGIISGSFISAIMGWFVLKYISK